MMPMTALLPESVLDRPRLQYGLGSTLLIVAALCVVWATRHPAPMIVSTLVLLPALSFRTHGAVAPGMLAGCVAGHLAAMLLLAHGLCLNGGHQWVAVWT